MANIKLDVENLSLYNVDKVSVYVNQKIQKHAQLFSSSSESFKVSNIPFKTIKTKLAVHEFPIKSKVYEISKKFLKFI